MCCFEDYGKRCPNGWRYYGSACYWFSTAELDWNEARAACQAKDGELVTIRTPEVQVIHRLFLFSFVFFFLSFVVLIHQAVLILPKRPVTGKQGHGLI